MYRWDVINQIIEFENYKTYFEVGLGGGYNFNQIIAESKDGLEPNSGEPKIGHTMSSDAYFSGIAIPEKIKYDIIFIDGLHTYDQSRKDVINALSCLEDNGTIVMHDCLPPSEDFTVEGGASGYSGDVWKSFLELRSSREDLEMLTVDTDFGCGVLKAGSQEPFDLKGKPIRFVPYSFLQENKKEILNLISVENFRSIYSK